jgi:putative ABC transport system permease protein
VVQSPWLTVLVVVVMIGFAGYEAYTHLDRHFAVLSSWGLGVPSMAVAILLVTALALGAAVRPDPWHHPQYEIPPLGMVPGNTLTGVSLDLERLMASLAQKDPPSRPIC